MGRNDLGGDLISMNGTALVKSTSVLTGLLSTLLIVACYAASIAAADSPSWSTPTLIANEPLSAHQPKGQLAEPLDVATDSAGHVYVDDFGNGRIQKFTSNGAFLTAWGRTGIRIGHFRSVWGIGSSAHSIYVADGNRTFYRNNRIQKFTLGGRFVATWGAMAPVPVSLRSPSMSPQIPPAMSMSPTATTAVSRNSVQMAPLSWNSGAGAPSARVGFRALAG